MYSVAIFSFMEQRVELVIVLRLLQLLLKHQRWQKVNSRQIQSNVKDLENTVVREGVV